jgi:hypothetical protein
VTGATGSADGAVTGIVTTGIAAASAALRSIGDGAGAGVDRIIAAGSGGGAPPATSATAGAMETDGGPAMAVGVTTAGIADGNAAGAGDAMVAESRIGGATDRAGIDEAPAHGSTAIAGAAAGVPADTSVPTGSVAVISVPRNDGGVAAATGAPDGGAATIAPNSPPVDIALASPVGEAAPGEARIAAKGSVAADEIMRVSGGAAASPPASL